MNPKDAKAKGSKTEVSLYGLRSRRGKGLRLDVETYGPRR